MKRVKELIILVLLLRQDPTAKLPEEPYFVIPAVGPTSSH